MQQPKDTLMPAAAPTAFRSLRGATPLPILILDDERVDRHRLARLCSGLAFPCKLSNATTLDTFAEHLDAAPFGLILVDYALPDGTGLEALDLVRLSPKNASTPVLMVSAMASEDVRSQALARGCRGFLPKDGLTRDGFAQAIAAALPPSTAVKLKPRYPQAEAAQLLQRITTQTAQQTKPMVSRLLRQLRDLRSRTSTDPQTDLQLLEDNCLALWDHLSELEQIAGLDLLERLAEDLPHRTGDKGKKPPSPFAQRP